MTESQAVSKLIKQLNEYGYYWKSSDRFRAGIPDIVGCQNRRFIGIEAKVDYNTPSAIQTHTLLEMSKQGAYVAVVTYSNRNKKWWIGGRSFASPRLTALHIAERIGKVDNEL
jgi:hypothetical protein